jgi:hypothetical protein
MSLDPGPLVVALLYGLSLFVVLVVSRRFPEAAAPAPWWRNVRFWASFVAVVQILVYAVWG